MKSFIAAVACLAMTAEAGNYYSQKGRYGNPYGSSGYGGNPYYGGYNSYGGYSPYGQ